MLVYKYIQWYLERVLQMIFNTAKFISPTLAICVRPVEPIMMGIHQDQKPLHFWFSFVI